MLNTCTLIMRSSQKSSYILLTRNDIDGIYEADTIGKYMHLELPASCTGTDCIHPFDARNAERISGGQSRLLCLDIEMDIAEHHIFSNITVNRSHY